MSAPKVKKPEASNKEKRLLKNQAALLKQQSQIIQSAYEQQSALLPFFAAQAGIKLKMNKKGQIVGVKEEKPTKLEKQSEKIQKLLNKRSLKALKGKLPVDPALERELKNQKDKLKDRLMHQLGPGYKTSSPGIEALDKFAETKAVLRSQARRGELTLAEQLSLARRESDAAAFAQSTNLFRASAIGDPLSFASATGSNAAGYGNAVVPYIQDRQMELQANMMNAQLQQSFMGGIGSLAGTALGAIFSDAALKSNLEQIGMHSLGIPIYRYTFIDGVERIGILAQDVQRVKPELVMRIKGFLAVNYRGL